MALCQTLANADIVGAVVTVVSDGQIIANRGYGYSDLEPQTPVDPEHTLFRPGSVSKLFTWTAVMQQVEAGRLDLDADVNTYIDFAIPEFDGEPITLRNVMTHTTGFEEVVHDLIQTEDASTSLTLADYLKQNLPNRIYAPGTMPAYSNYAAALAGYIVERASGEPFPYYVQRHIFEPLHMEHATFVQPLPDAMRSAMSRAYLNRSNGQTQPFEIVPASPAGALSATGPDMALFMIAHLNQGAGLLRPETAQMMHETIDRQFPVVNSMALGFYRQDLNSERILGHAGDTQFFHSNLALLMDQNVGVFISLNSSGGQTTGARLLRQHFMQAFTDRYFPAPHEVTPEPLATAQSHGAAVAGDYESSRRSDSSALSAIYFLGQKSISVLPNGDLVGIGLPHANGEPAHWREVEPWIWRTVDGSARMSARLDDDGRVTTLSVEPASFAIEFVRAPWWRSNSLLLPLLGLAIGTLVLTFIAWPIRAIARRVHKLPSPTKAHARKRIELAAPHRCLCLHTLGAGFFLLLICRTR